MQLHDSSGASERPASAAYEDVEADLCIIGAGSGGLSVAAAAAAFGRRVVLVEKAKMGGDCLNYGCVPSKALIAAARRAHDMRTSRAFGIDPVEPAIDHGAVHDHVHQVMAAIEPNDSIERFTAMGVRVVQAAARFIARDCVLAGNCRIKARRFVVATGSSPVIPPIPGLDKVPFFTNETIFDNRQKLERLVVIGGGPVGMELAQAHARLGSRVTVLEAATVLGKDDSELASVVLAALEVEGIDVRDHAKVVSVEGRAGAIRLTVEAPGKREVVDGTHVLVATGRKPNISELDLEAGGIAYGKQGITVNSGLVTSNPKVFAIGDCVGGQQFTHVANYHAGIVIRRALFRLPAKVNEAIIPWATFTDPELAYVGLSEGEARRSGPIRVLRWPLRENDRAQAERATNGFAKVVTDNSGRILGAGIVGAHAGELIQVWALAIARRLKIKAMTDWVVPYPTLGEVNKRAAYCYYSTAPGNPLVRKAIGLLAKLG